MEIASKLVFGVAAGCVLWILHRWIGAYPPPLPLSSSPRSAARTAVLLQGLAGSLFGLIYVKTRSLWPGVACHYLINWFSAVLAAAFRA
jgi:membrane protease YdiL (CAAX protease family)